MNCPHSALQLGHVWMTSLDQSLTNGCHIKIGHLEIVMKTNIGFHEIQTAIQIYTQLYRLCTDLKLHRWRKAPQWYKSTALPLKVYRNNQRCLWLKSGYHEAFFLKYLLQNLSTNEIFYFKDILFFRKLKKKIRNCLLMRN